MYGREGIEHRRRDSPQILPVSMCRRKMFLLPPSISFTPSLHTRVPTEKPVAATCQEGWLLTAKWRKAVCRLGAGTCEMQIREAANWLPQGFLQMWTSPPSHHSTTLRPVLAEQHKSPVLTQHHVTSKRTVKSPPETGWGVAARSLVIATGQTAVKIRVFIAVKSGEKGTAAFKRVSNVLSRLWLFKGVVNDFRKIEFQSWWQWRMSVLSVKSYSPGWHLWTCAVSPSPRNDKSW